MPFLWLQILRLLFLLFSLKNIKAYCYLFIYHIKFNGLYLGFRFGSFSSWCSVTNTDAQFNDVATESEAQENSSVEPKYSVPIVNINSDILETECLGLLAEESYVGCLLTTLPVCKVAY